MRGREVLIAAAKLAASQRIEQAGALEPGDELRAMPGSVVYAAASLALVCRRRYALSRLASHQYNGEVITSPTSHDRSAPLMCSEIGPTYSGVFMNGICTTIPTA
ncbi:hypothetical protein D3C79_998700 [compost metagenome]